MIEEKIVNILEKFQLVIEIQDSQIKDLQDRVKKLEFYLSKDKKENATDNNKMKIL